jgi:SAM-dependent methyltransferase
VLWQPLLKTLERLRLLQPLFGLHERLTTLRTADSEMRTSEGLPLPPAHLRTLTAGTADSRWFLESGRASARTIREAASRHGVPLDSARLMLDFGCGCGRVLRHWNHMSLTEVHGAEPSESLAEWCARNLPFARVLRSPPLPPLPYESGGFDLVYAVSVFTHLTEQQQILWQAELARIIRPGGLLLLTLHGDRYLGSLTATERSSYEQGRLVVRHASGAGTNLCAAYHPAAFVRERFSEGFVLVEHTTAGFAGGAPEQDLVVLRKP